jgi:hypothetical protein
MVYVGWYPDKQEFGNKLMKAIDFKELQEESEDKY